ncbi:hypothetical protein OpiT1DRAFT_04161 [Opitutaceae bacterium TAV1]|nr:hypothetical protein OpiT1DRAFT_04161 [Opitutaceae bacterium TAV1]
MSTALEAPPQLGHGPERTSTPEANTARFPLPTVDLSGDTARQVVIAAGSENSYQGHPTTLLMPDGKTMFCVWTHGHGGPCGPLKRSDDGGLTWSGLLPVPANWREVRNCPTIFRLPDPRGKYRLFVYAGQGPDGCIHESHSENNGRTWSPMRSLGLTVVMPFCTIVPIDGGRTLLGLTNIRREGDGGDAWSNVVAQSISGDGGFSWTPWRVIADNPELRFCEPWLVPSPDGRELTCLMRENMHGISWRMTTRDEGISWTKPEPLPVGLAGDRHVARYAADGRLVVVFRDRALASGTTTHFVAWVGRYDDLSGGDDAGDYRIKLLHSHAGYDCGYPGLELLPDGTFVATTYIKYRPGPEQHSVVSTRFTLAEADRKVARASCP